MCRRRIGIIPRGVPPTIDDRGIIKLYNHGQGAWKQKYENSSRSTHRARRTLARRAGRDTPKHARTRRAGLPRSISD